MSGYKSGIIIAAIDFGTTYSGYAFSFKHEIDIDRPKIQGRNWEHSQIPKLSKCPTVILFDQDRNFHSFGYEAEKKYADLSDDDRHIGWRYFKHFKMALYGKKKLRHNLKLTDDQGKKMRAMDVFAAAIRYLKNDLLELMKQRTPEFNETDIMWVITIPTIWKYGAKQFMKEAAAEAGIPDDQFTFALEPEAGAIFCKQLEIWKQVDANGRIVMDRFSPGSRFMLLDLGGGTADITVTEVQEDKSLGEIYPPSGGPYGGTSVDENINKMFEEIFGSDVFDRFKSQFKYAYLNLCESLERKKREFGRSVMEEVRIDIPHQLLDIYNERNPDAIQKKIDKSSYAGKVYMHPKHSHMKINNDIFHQTYLESVGNLLKHMTDLFGRTEVTAVQTIMMVGGFSESTVVQKAVRERFPNKIVIIAEEAGLAVLQGAVLCGYNNKLIRSRKIPYSYGISTNVPFDPAIHPPEKIYYTVGRSDPRCEDIFHPFIRKGDTVYSGETRVTHAFNAACSPTEVEVYQSYADNLPDPSFITDEEVERTGTLKLTLEKVPSEVEVTMYFGVIDVKVQAKDRIHGTTVNATFNCLYH